MKSYSARDAVVAAAIARLREKCGKNSMAGRLRNEALAPVAKRLANELAGITTDTDIEVGLSKLAGMFPQYFGSNELVLEPKMAAAPTITRSVIDKLSATEKLTYANTGTLPHALLKKQKP